MGRNENGDEETRKRMTRDGTGELRMGKEEWG